MLLQTTQKRWLESLTHCIAQGDTVIIENLGEAIDTSLQPIIKRDLFKKGRHLYMRTRNGNTIFDSDFKLYLQTKLANPHYKPELCAQCTLVNCIVTPTALQDRLMEQVVHREEPELEAQRADLRRQFNEHRVALLALEDQLLERLSKACVGHEGRKTEDSRGR